MIIVSPGETAFSVFGFSVFWYGIILAVAILCGVFCAEFLGKKIFIQQRDNSQKDECTALRLDKNGNLIVKTLSGKEKTILSGDLIL